MLGNPLLLGDDGYQISRSVRLRSSASAYFSRTPSSASNRQKWSYSQWIKRGTIGSGGQVLICAGISGDFSPGGSAAGIAWDNDKIQVFGGNTGTFRVNSSALYRDPAAFYHVVVAFDTTLATASDRVKIWVNNNLVTSFDTTPTYPSQNAQFQINNNVIHYIGAQQQFSGNYFDGYMADVYLIDGQALTPAAFGETDAITGVWKPKRYTGTYGTNGFYLNFSDPSAATAAAIGKDYSGNGNNWTPNNISVTSGATYDSMLDVPTLWADGGNGRGNYAVLNPLDRSTAGALTAGNLDYTYSSNAYYNGVRGTIGVSSGKWYWETTCTAIGSGGVYAYTGVATNTFNYDGSTNVAINAVGTYYYMGNGNKSTGTGAGQTTAAYGATYTTGDVIGVALDMDAGTLTFYKNGSTQGTAYTGLSGSLFPAVVSLLNVAFSTNFGQRPFAYTPPSGFKALHTGNLPEPTIKKPNQYMDVSLYTGNAGSITVTNAGFQPDLVWIKARSSAYDHKLVDSGRGASGGIYYDLQSNSTATESLPGAGVNGLTSTGFTIGGGTNNGYNGNGTTFVAWQWKEGATPGFDIVTYTGNGTTGQNVPHSLGVAPKMIIAKARSVAGTDWVCYHSALGKDAYILLNTTAASGSLTNAWGSTAPSSSSFGVYGGASNAGNNYSGASMIAYLFAEVPGFSKFGSYTGNGSADGVFVFTGFRPRFIMHKRIDTGGVNQDWRIWDSARDPSNASQGLLFPNRSDSEAVNAAHAVDLLSNGFKFRTSDSNVNTSGGTFIFAAFAENPFKYSLAR